MGKEEFYKYGESLGISINDLQRLRMLNNQDVSDISKVTRFEVIDESGRSYTRHNSNVELSYQDDGKTLKVFINKEENG